MKSAFTCLTAILPLAVNAQVTAIKNFLLTAQKDYAVVAQQGNASVLKSSSFSLPLLNDIQFDIRNRAYQFDKQRYTLQVEPRGFGETRASKNYYTSQVGLAEKEIQLCLNDALKLRYTYIIDLLERQAMQRAYGEMTAVYEDRIKVLEKTTYSSDFDLSAIITAEEELTKLKAQDIEEQKEILVLKREIARYLNDTAFTEFDTAGLIAVETIGERVAQVPQEIDTNNVYLNTYRNRFETAEKRYRLEMAQSRRYITSLSFSYDHGSMLDELERRKDDKDFDLNNAYILQIGFRIPYLTTDKREIGRRNVDFLSNRESYEQLKRDLAYRMSKDRDDIQALITQYRYLKARENEVDAQASLKKYLQMSGVDPLMLLSIKEVILKNALKKEKTRFAIIRNYLRVLDVTGQLSQSPLRNHLSKDREVIIP